MIAALRGKILFKDTTRVIVDVQGVGYDVSVSRNTMGSLPDEGEVFFHIHTALRENSLELYGFTVQDEKSLFEMLLGVTGIGPRLALTILSGVSPDLFQKAVLEGDVHRLTAIPGIGKKSAERIVLELKEKIKKAGLSTLAQAATGLSASLEEDLVSSLVNLGYKEHHARAAGRKAMQCCEPGVPLPDAVKLALKELAK